MAARQPTQTSATLRPAARYAMSAVSDEDAGPAEEVEDVLRPADERLQQVGDRLQDRGEHPVGGPVVDDPRLGRVGGLGDVEVPPRPERVAEDEHEDPEHRDRRGERRHLPGDLAGVDRRRLGLQRRGSDRHRAPLSAARAIRSLRSLIDLRSRPLGLIVRCVAMSLAHAGWPGLVERLDALELGQLHQLGGAEDWLVGVRVAARRVEIVPGHRHQHPAAVDGPDDPPGGVQHRQGVLAGGDPAHQLGQLRRGVDRGSAPSCRRRAAAP